LLVVGLNEDVLADAGEALGKGGMVGRRIVGKRDKADTYNAQHVKK